MLRVKIFYDRKLLQHFLRFDEVDVNLSRAIILYGYEDKVSFGLSSLGAEAEGGL